MRLRTLFPLLLTLCVATSAEAQGTLGNTADPDAGVTVGLADYVLGFHRVQATETGALTSLSARVASTSTAGGKFKLAIWADSAGVPGALVAQTAEITLPNPAETQLITANVTASATITASSYYWIGSHHKNGTTVYYGANNTNDQAVKYASADYLLGIPDPFPSPSSLANVDKCCVYATYSTDSVTASAPAANVIIQRDVTTGLGTIAIAGTYVGTPTAIEASFAGGSYATIDTSPSDGAFSGSLTGQAGGQGTLTIRWTNDTAVSTTVANVGIGDRFLILGDSISEGKGTNAQSHGHATLKAYAFRENDSRVEANDPVDTSTASGSHWPLLIKHIMDDQEVPVEIVTCGKGSTDVAGTYNEWAKNNAQYQVMVAQASDAGGTYRAALCHWGPNAVSSNLTQAAYDTAIDQFVSDMQTDVQAGLPLYLGIFGEVTTVTGTRNTLRAAILQAVEENASVGYGPCLIEQDYSDNVHPKSDADLKAVADRWWAALHDQLYGGSGGRGPRFSGAKRTADNVVTVYFDQSITGTTYTAAAFAMADASGARTITEVAKSADKSIGITVSGDPLAAPITVSFGSESTSVGATVPMSVDYALPDLSTVTLPAEPFYAKAVKAGSGGVIGGLLGI